jgi:hypothetical protein
MNVSAKPLSASLPNTNRDAVEFCDATIAGFRKKADHNKLESQGCFLMVIGATLATPLFVTLGDGLVLGKIIPSGLSAIAAGATAWLQLRKPQHLWALYRSAQRELEDHKTRHNYRIGAYAIASDPDLLLAERVADVAINVHHQWLPMVPSMDQTKIDAPQSATEVT